MTDYRDRHRFVRFLIDMKWKIIKGTRGPKGMVMLILMVLIIGMVIDLVVKPAILEATTNHAKELLPVCKSLCDYPV